ncbi:MAG: hypothetical protein LBH97_06995 [Treponema sp.]|jgi:hypothetical protein|nr:hypothetical protein [Treponema sp.]
MMKRFIIILLVCAFAFFGFSCASGNRGPQYPNMVADMDPFPIGTITAQFDRLLSSQLTTNDVQVFFYPRENAVVLQFRHEFVTYRQFWDMKGREQFSAALNRYKEDYAVRNLSTRYNRTKAVYGKVMGRLEWQSFAFTAVREASPVIDLGYRFKGDMPFFVTGQNPAREEGTASEQDKQEAVQVNMYFTRAQADELVKLFDQSWLLGLLGDRGTFRPMEESMEESTPDGYREYGD